MQDTEPVGKKDMPLRSSNRLPGVEIREGVARWVEPSPEDANTASLSDSSFSLKELREKSAITSPSHYTSHPSGIECIDVTRHMNFCLGNAFKYIWRAGLKDSDPIQDLEKAKQYLDFEIERITSQNGDEWNES